MINRSCIIDVGANEGDFAIEAARKNPDLTVIAFEPIPQLRDLIQTRAKNAQVENLIVRDEAILDEPGIVQLNIANHADMGVSSLLSFDKQNISEDDYWRSRTDLYHEDRICINAERLDNILVELGLESVEFIKIDAQGVDLRVLQSLGRFRPKAGMLEAATTRFKALYIGEPDLFETLQSLRESKYEIWEIKPNDPACAEVNVYFTDKSVNIRDIESRYSLMDIPLYGDKHYWFSHASNAVEAERRANDKSSERLETMQYELSALQRRLQELKTENSNIIAENRAIRNSKSWRMTSIFRLLVSAPLRTERDE